MCLEGVDGLCAGCRFQVLLYGQVVDVAGDGQWCGCIGCRYSTLLPPVLDHSADYTNYGNSLPQPCLPSSNLSATAWGKTD